MAGGELDAVMTAIGALPADAGQVPDAVLVARMQHLVAARAMLDAALVEQLAVFDARGGARHDGQVSTRAWLRSGLRLGGRAGDLLQVARQLADLPQVAKALAAGQISLEHAARAGPEPLGQLPGCPPGPVAVHDRLYAVVRQAVSYRPLSRTARPTLPPSSGDSTASYSPPLGRPMIIISFRNGWSSAACPCGPGR